MLQMNWEMLYTASRTTLIPIKLDLPPILCKFQRFKKCFPLQTETISFQDFHKELEKAYASN